MAVEVNDEKTRRLRAESVREDREKGTLKCSHKLTLKCLGKVSIIGIKVEIKLNQFRNQTMVDVKIPGHIYTKTPHSRKPQDGISMTI